MKRLLFLGFIALSLLRLSYAEPLCKNDLDCLIKYVKSDNVNYLVYGCDNYKDQSPGHSCTKLYGILLDKMKRDIIYLCGKGNSSACYYKIIYNFDGRFRNEKSVAKEGLEILKQSEQRCENREDVIECINAYQVYKLLGNSEKANYYLNKIIDY
jgi:hypothetical protein